MICPPCQDRAHVRCDGCRCWCNDERTKDPMFLVVVSYVDDSLRAFGLFVSRADAQEWRARNQSSTWNVSEIVQLEVAFDQVPPRERGPHPALQPPRSHLTLVPDRRKGSG